MPVQSQSNQFIPLNKLMASPRNVRCKDRKTDIEALAALTPRAPCESAKISGTEVVHGGESA